MLLKPPVFVWAVDVVMFQPVLPMCLVLVGCPTNSTTSSLAQPMECMREWPLEETGEPPLAITYIHITAVYYSTKVTLRSLQCITVLEYKYL